MTSNIPSINVKDLLVMNEEDIFNFQGGVRPVEFDDKTVQMSKEAIIYSWYLWHVHRKFEKTPLYSYHALTDQTLTPKTHTKILAKIRLTVLETYGFNNNKQLEELSMAVSESFNKLYNGLTVKLPQYITSISILDFIDVHFHEKIYEINRTLKNAKTLTNAQIGQAHEQVVDILKNDPSLKHNAIARAVRHGLTKEGQLLQCVSARGYVSEVDRRRFPLPIKTGYVEGMRSFAEYAIESRTATAAAFITKDPMRAVEYINRQFQLSTAVIKRIHNTDCGSKRNLTILIDTLEKLQDLEGIHYFDNDQERVIAGNEKTLLHKPLKIRTIFTCQHPDRYGVCASCFGDLAFNQVNTDNVGHNSAVALQSDQTQLMLSHKHHTKSASGKSINVATGSKDFLDKRLSHPNNMFLKKQKGGLKVYIYLDEGRDLDNLKHLTDLARVTPERITSLSNLGVIITDKAGERREVIDVKVDSRNSHLTAEALEYLFEHNWKVNEKGAYLVDLKDWDYDKPFLGVPEEQFSAQEYSEQIGRFIKGTGGSKTSKAKPHSEKVVTDFERPEEALMALHELVALKLHVNISYLTMILYGVFALDPEAGRYNLPLPEDRSYGEFTKHSKKMKHGNVSAMMAYQEQTGFILNPNSYAVKGRPTHEFDYILLGEPGSR